MSINADQNHDIDPKYISMSITVDQFRSIPNNVDQFRSISINANQCHIKASVKHQQINAGSILLDLALIGIDRNLEELIRIDQH